MAYFKLHAYDADVWIPAFIGLGQSDESLNEDPRYAAEEKNLETPNGVLQPQAPMTPLSGGSFENRIETIAIFHRRWYTGNGSKDWMVAATGGRIWVKQVGSNEDWAVIDMPAGLTGFSCNVWSYATYESNEGGTTVDVLLISNAQDGMFMIVPPDRPAIWSDLTDQTWDTVRAKTWNEIIYSPEWQIRTVDTGDYKFGVIARHAERIWGGAVDGEPDLLVYSAPYDPTDWEANTDIPEDGAGIVKQPSWDGDRFTTLKSFGDQLVAFKQNKLWRVQGTSPGDFSFKEQFGGGAPFFNTAVVDVERIMFATRDGISVYDGMSVSPFARKYTERIWRTINKDAMDQMCATIFQHRYYLAFPTGTSTVNNAMLVYDMINGSMLYYTDIYIESFLNTDDVLLSTSSNLPGKVIEISYDSWVQGAASGAATKWVSPWLDFGYKRIVKGGFDLYFVPEVQDTSVELKFSVQMEKKVKTKTYTVSPLTSSEQAAHRRSRGKRLHFSGTGRRFRIIIETASGVTAPWRLIGGIQLVVETDPD